jgi:hypothetical protein
MGAYVRGEDEVGGGEQAALVGGRRRHWGGAGSGKKKGKNGSCGLWEGRGRDEKAAREIQYCLRCHTGRSGVAVSACFSCRLRVGMLLFFSSKIFFSKRVYASLCITVFITNKFKPTKVSDTEFMDRAWWIHKSTNETSKL